MDLNKTLDIVQIKARELVALDDALTHWLKWIRASAALGNSDSLAV